MNRPLQIQLRRPLPASAPARSTFGQLQLSTDCLRFLLYSIIALGVILRRPHRHAGRHAQASPPNLFSLHGLSLAELVKRTWKEIRAEDVFGRAAQLAYYFFLALFPFLICVIASLSVFGTADRGRALLFAIFARFLPAPAFQLISDTFSQIIKSSGPLKMSFGIVTSVWAASMGMSAVMDTLNAAYRVNETRSLFKQYLVAIGLTCGIALLLIVSIVIAILGDNLVGPLSHGNWIAILWKIMQWPLALALLLFAFSLTYYFAPDLVHRQWHWITPGAIAGIILLMIVSTGLRLYIRYSSSYTATYGSLGAVIVLLLCFYLSGIAVLTGGALNGVLESAAAASGRRLAGKTASLPAVRGPAVESR